MTRGRRCLAWEMVPRQRDATTTPDAPCLTPVPTRTVRQWHGGQAVASVPLQVPRLHKYEYKV